MNIAFIANYTQTDFFQEIAKNLISKGIKVYWFTVNNKIYKNLIREYSQDHVLLINEQCKGQKIGDYKINELIFGDRTLKHQPKIGKEYLLNIQKPILNFLQKNKIKYVFGETTWAHEILICRICNQLPELNCQFLFPHTIRIPNGRFAFFEDEYASKIYNFDYNKTSDKTFEIEKPTYAIINDQKIKKSRSFTKRFERLFYFINSILLSNRDKNDPTLIKNKITLFKLRIQEEINKETYRFVPKKQLSEIIDKKYIYYTIHKQPEQSIDVIGRYNENQFLNIINLWRILPEDWYIVVKEHTNAIGDRSYSFFNKLLNYQNILIANETINSLDLIKKSQYVACVSGTSAYEAGLLGKKSLLFGETFFKELNAKKIDVTYLQSIKNIYDIKVNSNIALSKFKKIIMGNSYEGEIGDPVHLPHTMSTENIQKVTTAFLKILK